VGLVKGWRGLGDLWTRSGITKKKKKKVQSPNTNTGFKSVRPSGREKKRGTERKPGVLLNFDFSAKKKAKRSTQAVGGGRRVAAGEPRGKKKRSNGDKKTGEKNQFLQG